MASVRLVLSGGSAKGVLEGVGALNAVVDRGHEIVVGAGTSAGGVILGAFASGKSAKDLKDVAMKMDFTKFISTGFFAKLRAAFTGTLSDGKALLKFFNELTGGKKFKDATFDVRITGADYSDGQPRVFTKSQDAEMPLALAMRITSAMPLAFSAAEYGGRWYKDGGVYAHVPIDASRDLQERTVVFAQAHDHTDAHPDEHEDWAADVGIVREIERTLDLLVDSNVHSSLEKAPADTVKAFSDGLKYGSFKFDFSQAEKDKLFAHGYDLVKAAMTKAGL